MEQMGLMHLWQASDFVAKFVFVVVAVMFAGTAYYIVTASVRNFSIRSRAHKVVETFWQTSNPQEAIRAMEAQPPSEPFSKIALIFDRSERLGPQIGRIFSDLRVTQTLEGTTRQIPVELCDAPKRLCEPALEVADFIIHTAGRAVRKSIDGMPFLENPDFRAIFETQPQELSEFVRLDAAGWRRVAA